MMLSKAFPDIADCLPLLVALNPDEPLKTWATVISMIVGGVALVTTLVTKTYPWARAKFESRKVAHSLGASLITPGNIERTIRYYVPPYTQSLDPAGGEESRLIHSVKSPLFKTLDDVLSPEGDDRYHILLADSGMGKTSALLNYYVRHRRRWWKKKKFDIAIVPLGIPDADDRIKAIQNRQNTVLFLDALDEDTLAMVDHVERLRLLLKATSDFQRVVITCRTQFFARDEEIPQGTGILKFGSRRGDESAEQVFYKIYLTPFTDEQIKHYLIKRYPIWRWKRRERAFELVKKIPHLTARPMLLSRIDDLVDADREFKYSFQLYEEMVAGWIRREKGFVNESDQLREFSERLAVNLYLNRGERGAERVTRDEIESLAKSWGISIFPGNLSGRALLNRDAEGNFKFAHRSIMEYLFVKHAIVSEQNCFWVEWTDQMKRFLWEMIEQRIDHHGTIPEFVRTMLFMPRQHEAVLNLLKEVALAWKRSQQVEYCGSPTLQAQTFVALCASALSMSVREECHIHIHSAPLNEIRSGDKPGWASIIPTHSWGYSDHNVVVRKPRAVVHFPVDAGVKDPSVDLIKESIVNKEVDIFGSAPSNFKAKPEFDAYELAYIHIITKSFDQNVMWVGIIIASAKSGSAFFSAADIQWLREMFRYVN